MGFEVDLSRVPRLLRVPVNGVDPIFGNEGLEVLQPAIIAGHVQVLGENPEETIFLWGWSVHQETGDFPGADVAFATIVMNNASQHIVVMRVDCEIVEIICSEVLNLFDYHSIRGWQNITRSTGILSRCVNGTKLTA